uniref:Interferon gamma n=1 Tax=Hippoglossus hippoglossus TaxID=8267 RepID=G4V499_HIPHI|nr:interferon gamma [Hippoglossus hippoglossus]ADP55201.1 interferon gamma [Hippoglossus hippoglossus]
MMVSTAKEVVYLSLCLCVCQVRGSHIPEKMNRTIQNLLRTYNIGALERYNGTPVFPREPLVDSMEKSHLSSAEKMTFMGGVLETYEKLFGQMLEQRPNLTPPTAGGREGLDSAANAVPGAGDDEVRTDLMYILGKIQDLRRHRYQEQSKLLQRLHDLGKVQMDDRTIQSKALGELPWLYAEASSLSSIKKQTRRRRRQARKVIGHQ